MRFFVQNFAPKITNPNITGEKLPKSFTYEKGARKTLMKLTPERKCLS